MDRPTFIVRRLNWRRTGEPGWLARLPGAVTVARHRDPESAERDRAAREAAARALVNPFRCGPALADVTNMPPWALKDYLQDDGIKAAKADSFARLSWPAWWDKFAPGWSPAARERVWAALDRVRFFDVRTVEPGGSVWVAVRALAGEDGRVPRHMPEGGRIVGALRRRADARAAVDLFAEDWSDGASPASLRGVGPTRDPFGDPRARESFDQVFEVPLTGDPSGRAWCVARRAVSVGSRTDGHTVGPRYVFDRFTEFDPWDDGFTPLGWERTNPARRAWSQNRPADVDHLVPEAVFADPADAEAYRADAERDVRRLVNPFRFGRLASHYEMRAGQVVHWELSDGTSVLQERFAALGLPDPGNPPSPLAWAAHVQPLGDSEFHAAYDAVDGVRFYRLVEVEVD